MAILPSNPIIMRSRILICDDNDGDVYILLDTLKTVGLSFDYIRARDGAEALGFLTGPVGFDLVILDQWLPRMSGLEVIQALRSKGGFPDCPVVILTSGMGKERKELGALGVHTIFEKPLSLDGYLEIGESIAKLMLTV